MSLEEPPTAEMPPTADLHTKLAQLQAAATQQYALKNYSLAAESYSEAAEIQDTLNGEMALDNADLLYQYGRCLFHVAIANSDVLGGKVAGSAAAADAKEPSRKRRKTGGGGGMKAEGSANASAGVISDALKDGEEKLAEEVVEAVVEEKEAGALHGKNNKKKEEDTSSKPYFQITGDENFTDSEEEDDDDDQDPETAAAAAADAEAAEEEEDDFATAFEILDIARILLTKKLALTPASSSSSSSTHDRRQLQERLADTHDLQAEISLETERFHDAANDARDALALKLQLYPPESSLIAEAHFKVSLALEFASVTSASEDAAEGEEQKKKTAQVNEAMRAQAAEEMEKAIASCELRITKEESLLSSLPTTSPKRTEQQKSIADVKEMVEDMQQRLLDLRKPAVSLSGPTGPAGAAIGDDDPVRGILGDLLGESKLEQRKRIQEATATANDLSGLVKRGKKKKMDEEGAVKVEDGEKVNGNGKRKVEDVDGIAEGGKGGGKGKKVKFEEVVEEEEVVPT